jgi:hypothetical protein
MVRDTNSLSLAIERNAAVCFLFSCCLWFSVPAGLFRLKDEPIVCENFRFNENFNAAVVESPPYVHKILNYCRMKLVRSCSLFMDYPENGNGAKRVYFNEKSNYNTRIRKAKPHCFT